ncbi:hypothetical protein KP509_18G003100 [Ceratopteris richardii]|uniref:Uncharacterized protein n=1 Tax=Ceratopteris richardii TaxID=49495 RepID=A0A8T2SM08_CERRI|nr:hypothetical protein KP509_18G003100 [Ceratopteris richardii]
MKVVSNQELVYALEECLHSSFQKHLQSLCTDWVATLDNLSWIIINSKHGLWMSELSKKTIDLRVLAPSGHNESIDMETNSELTENWDEIEVTVKRYAQKKRAMEKFMQDWQEDLQEEQIQTPHQPAPNAQVNPPTGKDIIPPNTIEEMFKRFSDLTIQITNNKALKVPKIKRCIWCDSLEHKRYSCERFKEALAKNLVFIKEKMIYDLKTGEKININFGGGGMRVFFLGTFGNVASTSHTSTYAC